MLCIWFVRFCFVNWRGISRFFGLRKCGDIWSRIELNLSENRKVCCFKLLSLGVVCYVLLLY